MAAAKLVRTPFVPTKDQKAFFWNLLTAMVQPLTETHEEQFRKKVARLVNAKPHQLVSWDTVLTRNSKFHAKFMVMVHVGYDAWDPDRDRTKRAFAGRAIRKSFDDFRGDVTVATGFYDVTYNLDGTLNKTAKSLAFDSMEEDEFELVYTAVADVLISMVLRNYNRAELDRVVRAKLGEVVAELEEFIK